MRVLAISGSLRRASYNTALLRHAVELFAAEGAELEIHDELIGHVMNRFDEDGRLNDPNLEEEVREIIRDLLAEIDDRSPEPDTLDAA